MKRITEATEFGLRDVIATHFYKQPNLSDSAGWDRQADAIPFHNNRRVRNNERQLRGLQGQTYLVYRGRIVAKMQTKPHPQIELYAVKEDGLAEFVKRIVKQNFPKIGVKYVNN